MQDKNRVLRYIATVLSVVCISTAFLSARDFVHIFTSKGIYETCEDLWFKCIVLDGSSLELSDKSHTAFVEIVNPSDSVVWKEKYPIVNGECDGQVYVGDDWETGEYRMYVHTASSLGLNDTQLTPKKLLIVMELPESQAYATRSARNEMILDSISYGKIRPLNITVELDSAEYHTRSKVCAKIKVTDASGAPVSTTIALSVYDQLYRYRPGELDLMSHGIAIQKQQGHAPRQREVAVLSDGPIAGFIKFRKKKNEMPLNNQFINLFDYSNTIGNLNIVATERDGRFEVPMDMAESLGWEVLMKPVSGRDMKPEIEISAPFAAISKVRRNTTDTYYPVLQKKSSYTLDNDTLDYSGRRTVRLDEVIVKGHAGRYPKRNKLLGYLDSISTITGAAWTCGCPAGGNTTFLNDYIPGYTHHPNGYGRPDKIGVPVKGKDYELIKYSGGTTDDWVEDIRHVIYPGPKYSEEELLRKNGLWKAKGYYPHHDFIQVDEEELSLGLEDNRNTLVWLPCSTTDDNGELMLEFFTSDITSVFNIQGLAITQNQPAIGILQFQFSVK